MFTKVALLCPAITSLKPYAHDQEINDYIARTGAYRANVNNTLYLMQGYYQTDSAWNRAAPIANAEASVTSSFPPLFVSVGAQDQYGFFEGAKAFADAARSHGAQAKYVLVQGYHCAFDSKAAVEFLTP